jgi:hypothetical protein
MPSPTSLRSPITPDSVNRIFAEEHRGGDQLRCNTEFYANTSDQLGLPSPPHCQDQAEVVNRLFT